MMFHYHKLLNKDQFEDDSCYYPTMNDSRGDVATSFYPPQVSPRYWWQKNSPVYRKIIPSHVCLFKPANVATLRYIHHKHIVSLCLSTLGTLVALWKGSNITWKKRSFINPLQTLAINCTIPNPRQLLLNSSNFNEFPLRHWLRVVRHPFLASLLEGSQMLICSFGRCDHLPLRNSSPSGGIDGTQHIS